MQFYPDHIKNRVEDASARFLADVSDFHKHFQVVCSCGGRLFELLHSNRKSVVAVCSACDARIVIYDLAHYAAAVKIAGPEAFDTLKSMPMSPTHVFVMFEYGEAEHDMDFNCNDITSTVTCY